MCAQDPDSSDGNDAPAIVYVRRASSSLPLFPLCSSRHFPLLLSAPFPWPSVATNCDRYRYPARFSKTPVPRVFVQVPCVVLQFNADSAGMQPGTHMNATFNVNDTCSVALLVPRDRGAATRVFFAGQREPVVDARGNA
jgi:hypothetical protein